MHPDRHLQQLRPATGRVVAALEGADLAAPIPTCPGWDVTALVEHLGGAHLWAQEAALTGRRPERMPAREDGGRPLAEWYADAAERLIGTLTRLDAGAPAWTFAAGDRTVAFWRRRQLHETLVHAADLALAGRRLGDLPAERLYGGVCADIAADGIAEILEVFLPRMARGAPGHVADVIPAPVPIVLSATDANASWTLQVTGDDLVITPGATPDAAATLSGTAAALDLAIWRRTGWDRVERRGDPAAAAAFIDGLRLP